MWLTQREQLLNRGLEVWKPVIAAVNGDCLAGGMTLLLGTDIRVAAEHATFGIAEVKRGILPGNGGTQSMLEQLPYAIAMEMLLTGDPMDAPNALRCGLINRVVPKRTDGYGARVARKIAATRRSRCKPPRSSRCARAKWTAHRSSAGGVVNRICNSPRTPRKAPPPSPRSGHPNSREPEMPRRRPIRSPGSRFSTSSQIYNGPYATFLMAGGRRGHQGRADGRRASAPPRRAGWPSLPFAMLNATSAPCRST